MAFFSLLGGDRGGLMETQDFHYHPVVIRLFTLYIVSVEATRRAVMKHSYTSQLGKYQERPK